MDFTGDIEENKRVLAFWFPRLSRCIDPIAKVYRFSQAFASLHSLLAVAGTCVVPL